MCHERKTTECQKQHSMESWPKENEFVVHHESDTRTNSEDSPELRTFMRLIGRQTQALEWTTWGLLSRKEPCKLFEQNRREITEEKRRRKVEEEPASTLFPHWLPCPRCRRVYKTRVGPQSHLRRKLNYNRTFFPFTLRSRNMPSSPSLNQYGYNDANFSQWSKQFNSKRKCQDEIVCDSVRQKKEQEKEQGGQWQCEKEQGGQWQCEKEQGGQWQCEKEQVLMTNIRFYVDWDDS